MLMRKGPAGRSKDSREHDPPLPKEGGETEREKKFGDQKLGVREDAVAPTVSL